MTEAAKAAGITRETASRWKNQDPGFVAELNCRRYELWEGMVTRLRGLVPEAIDRLTQMLRSNNTAVQLKAATLLLGTVQLTQGPWASPFAPSGPGTAPHSPEKVTEPWRRRERDTKNIAALDEDVSAVLEFAAHTLGNAASMWERMEPKQRMCFQWLLFPSGLTFDGEDLGTTEMSSVFNLLGLKMAGKSKLASPVG